MYQTKYMFLQRACIMKLRPLIGPANSSKMAAIWQRHSSLANSAHEMSSVLYTVCISLMCTSGLHCQHAQRRRAHCISLFRLFIFFEKLLYIFVTEAPSTNEVSVPILYRLSTRVQSWYQLHSTLIECNVCLYCSETGSRVTLRNVAVKPVWEKSQSYFQVLSISQRLVV